MAVIQRTASATWRGDLKAGAGQIDSTSGVLAGTPYTFMTRFENAKGTNPEELIAAANAACYSMALAHHLSQKGHVPESIITEATLSLDNGVIARMHLRTRGRVPGLGEAEFERMAEDAEKQCKVSNALRGSVAITLDAALAT